jgi:hypothetical protein
MKKIVTLIAIVFTLKNTTAQIQTNLVVSTNPPSTLTQWSINRETLIYIVSRPQGGGGIDQYKIKTEIKTVDGIVVGRTDLSKSKTYTFGSAASTTYTAIDVLPLESMIFIGSAKNTLDKTGKLPSNTYQICVQLVRPVDFSPVSEERCRTFNLAAAQLPILLKPFEDEIINYDLAKKAIIFRWSPVSPMPKTVTTYKLMVFEVLPHQNSVQAMRSNFPILTTEVRGATQYIWQPQAILNDKVNDVKTVINTDSSKTKHVHGDPHVDKQKNKVGHSGDPHDYKTYVWTIQSFDNLGMPIGDGNSNGDGVSEPRVFNVRHEPVKNTVKNIR